MFFHLYAQNRKVLISESTMLVLTSFVAAKMQSNTFVSHSHEHLIPAVFFSIVLLESFVNHLPGWVL